MAPVRNAQVFYNEIPTGYPVPGKTIIYDEFQTTDLDTAPLNGGILVKVVVLSIDPFMRKRMQDPDGVPSPFPNFEIGKAIDNHGVAVVLRSENPGYKAGDHVQAFLPFQEYAIVQSAHILRTIENKESLPWSVYAGVCGLPGETAHHAWKEFSGAKKGDVVFITAASGAVGSIVVQLAKASGCRVIASAGSDEKVAFVSSLGADVVFNYKTTKTRDVLKKEGLVNIYWDNVGGEALDAALEFAAQKASFIICGMISSYNTSEPYNVKNLPQIVWREIAFHGFNAGNLSPKYAEEFYQTFPAAVASGQIKYKEYRVKGLAHAGEAFLDVLQGRNIGKAILIVSDE